MLQEQKSKYPVQSEFIRRLKEVAPAHLSLVDHISDVLGISVDSAYRRLRGDTALSIDETIRLCQEFQISLDGLHSAKGNAVTFQYFSLKEGIDNFERYLQSIYMHLQTIKNSSSGRLIYAAEEVPIFHSFDSPLLTSFKMFYWNRSVLNHPEFQNVQFKPDLLPASLLTLGANINEAYRRVPSVEVWTDETIFTSTRQVEYYFHSGLFQRKEDALAVLESLKNMAISLRTMAERGNKNEQFPDQSGFSLYKSDIVIGTNCIHVELEEKCYSFISFNTVNSLTTNNEQFCGETQQWMYNLMNRSDLISNASEKQRLRFFNNMNRQIELTMERIKLADL